MSQLAGITEHLPKLRRFARAVTGSQENGDVLVASVLQVLVKRRARSEPAHSSCVSLFKLLVQTYNNLTDPTVQYSQDDPNWPMVLGRMTPVSRQGFLLSAMEGFSNAECAEVLGISVDEFERLREVALSEIAQQSATDVLIIEDEVLIARDLERIVISLGHRVIGRARTHRAALSKINNQKPGLVLSDIQLADGSSGVDAVNEILATCPVPVIFITAFPERLLTGTKPEPTYLIAKPFNVDQVRVAISQVLFFGMAPRAAPGL